jgi:hypothetical protein
VVVRQDDRDLVSSSINRDLATIVVPPRGAVDLQDAAISANLSAIPNEANVLSQQVDAGQKPSPSSSIVS